jgi:hypothetical protein
VQSDRSRRPADEGAGPETDLAYHYTKGRLEPRIRHRGGDRGDRPRPGPSGVPAIMAMAVPENIGSWRVMEQAGLRYQGLVDYYGMKGLKKYLAARE